MTRIPAHSDTVMEIQKQLRGQHWTNLLRASRSCQTILLESRGAALSYEPATTHSNFLCFQCSSMQKINSSGKATAHPHGPIYRPSTVYPFSSISASLSRSPGPINKMTFAVCPSSVKYPSTPSLKWQSIKCLSFEGAH